MSSFGIVEITDIAYHSRHVRLQTRLLGPLGGLLDIVPLRTFVEVLKFRLSCRFNSIQNKSETRFTHKVARSFCENI